MKRISHCRPSAVFVVSVIALVMTSAGTAIATSKLINGDKLIEKGSLSGNRLRKGTITGAQIKLRTLGKVLRARNADHAATASNATTASTALHAVNAGNAITATNAVNATNAVDATKLAGQPASDYLSSASRIGTNGIIKTSVSATDPSPATAVPLFSSGPFSVTMSCARTFDHQGNPETYVAVQASSGEPDSVLDGQLEPQTDAPVFIKSAIAATANATSTTLSSILRRPVVPRPS